MVSIEIWLIDTLNGLRLRETHLLGRSENLNRTADSETLFA